MSKVREEHRSDAVCDHPGVSVGVRDFWADQKAEYHLTTDCGSRAGKPGNRCSPPTLRRLCWIDIPSGSSIFHVA
jgi:hypothetical protein